MDNILNAPYRSEAMRFQTARTPRRGGLAILMSLLLLLSTNAGAQTVSHPTVEITTAAKHYTYVHMLSATEKKDIEYIIVRASDGEIKTVFNACDVC